MGTPTIEGAKVTAKVQGETKGDKLIVFRYKSKERYNKKTGHRQKYTRLTIDKIIESGSTGEKTAKPARRRKKEVTENGS